MKVGDRVRVVLSGSRHDGRVGVIRHVLVAVRLDGDDEDELSWFEVDELAAVVEQRRRGDGTGYEDAKGTGRGWDKLTKRRGGEAKRLAKSREDTELKLARMQRERREREHKE